MIEAKVICDSIGEHSPRLLTIRATNPKFIHQETLRHRTIYIEDALRGDPDFSFSVSSSRAIPFRILLSEVENDERRAKPVKWGAERKGMSPGDEVPPHVALIAESIWKEAALDAAKHANSLALLGIHKSASNRIIEPYVHVHCLMTATSPGWLNFFGLRLDKAADPTLRALAEECWTVWNESTPQKLKSGQWHLPFVDDETSDLITGVCIANHAETGIAGDPWEYSRKVSTARCARLSYMSFETNKRSTIEEDLKLYDRLVGSYPIHASPAEHQATPDEIVSIPDMIYQGWKNPELHGNLPGWIQHRKTLPNEAIAPLPAEYRL